MGIVVEPPRGKKCYEKLPMSLVAQNAIVSLLNKVITLGVVICRFCFYLLFSTSNDDQSPPSKSEYYLIGKICIEQWINRVAKSSLHAKERPTKTSAFLFLPLLKSSGDDLYFFRQFQYLYSLIASIVRVNICLSAGFQQFLCRTRKKVVADTQKEKYPKPGYNTNSSLFIQFIRNHMPVRGQQRSRNTE